MKNKLIILQLIFCFGCMSLHGQQSSTASPATTSPVKQNQPKIMVIPFTKEGEDIRTVLESDFNKRVAVTKVKEAFDNRNFSTIDFTGKLKSALDDQLFTSDNQTDMKSQLVEMSGADIYVEVEVPQMISTSGGSNIARIILTGYDCSTGTSLSNKVCESNRFNTSDYGALVSNALKSCSEEFLNTMQMKFDDVVENGRPIKIIITLSQNAAIDMSSEIAPDGSPLADVIENWMGENAFKNNYNLQGSTDLKMIFDEVRIPLKDEKGKNYNANKFATRLQQFLKSKSLSAGKETKNGIIYITLK